MDLSLLAADPALAGLVDVARRLHDAEHACLLVVDETGSRAAAVWSGPRTCPGDELVLQVQATGAAAALATGGWAGAPVHDSSHRLVAVLAVGSQGAAAGSGDTERVDLTGLTTLAHAVAARLEALLPVLVPHQPRASEAHVDAPRDPGPPLVQRAALLDAGDEELFGLRAVGRGAAAALVLHVHGEPGADAQTVRAEVVRRLRSQLRPGDLLARLGPEAYAVLLPDLPAGARYVAIGVADRLGRSVGLVAGVTGASTGLAFVEAGPADAGTDASALLGQAERAAEVAARRGPGQFHVHRDPAPVDTRDDAQVERLLRTALDERSLVVHYQPVVGLSSRGVVGVEALVRLRDPDGGLVPPDRFIAIAERAGLIAALGDQVRRTAMHTVAAWKRELPTDRSLGLGVNLSVRELAEPGLVDSIRSALEDSGLPPAALTLEITESAFMDEGRGHEDVLAALRALGPKLFIDDFGTGFSSLSYLRRFPVDGLKIDRTFVGDLLSGPQPAAVTAAIVHLAQELGVHVVAEGVETEQQAEVLRGHGCRLAQGYLFARPQSAEAVRPLLLPAPRTSPDAALAPAALAD